MGFGRWSSSVDGGRAALPAVSLPHFAVGMTSGRKPCSDLFGAGDGGAFRRRFPSWGRRRGVLVPARRGGAKNSG